MRFEMNAMPFEVIPAIDLRGGKCVRLFQGDYARETVYSDDPVGVARRFAEAGVPRIHVVDLDGAAAGKPVNAAIVQAIASGVTTPIETGGGLRSLAAIETMLRAGATRVILGTAAAEDEDLVREAVRQHGEAIAVGVDARAGMVATHGWRQGGTIPTTALMQRMYALGVRRFIYTDIARDGALEGPNLTAIREAMAATPAAVIASGGVSSLADVRALMALGVEGAIIGKAVYTGAVDVRQAVTLARGGEEQAGHGT